MKKTIKILAMTMLAAMIMVIGSKTATAANYDLQTVKMGISDFDKSLAYPGTCNTCFAVMNLDGVTDFTISSSDESICTAEIVSNGNNTQSVDFTYIKPGKITLIATYKYKGKDYTSKAKIKVTPYKNPFKTLKLGSKSIQKTFNEPDVRHYGRFADGVSKVSGKKVLKVSLKKGYKMYQNPTFQTKPSVKKPMYYKKNGKINLSKVDYIHFYIRDKEGYKCSFGWANRKPNN